YPFFGSAVARWLGPGDSGLPPYISIKPGNGGFLPNDAGFLGPKYGALAFGDGKPPENLLRPATISAADDEARNDLRSRLDKRYAEKHAKETAEANAHVYHMASQLQKRMELFDSSTLSKK